MKMNITKQILSKYKRLSLPVKATMWYTVCNIIQKAISLLTTPLFTRMLTVEEYGEYSLYQSWLSLLMIFTTLTLNGGVFSKAMVKFDCNRDKYISSMQGLVTCITGIWVFLFLIMHEKWEAILGLPFTIILFMFFQMLAKVSFEFFGGKCRFEYRYIPYVFLVLVFSILNVGVSLLCVLYSSHKGSAKIYSDILSTIAIFGIIYVYNFYKGRVFYNREYWKYALKFSIPMLPYYISQMIFNQSDRIMIGNLLGETDAALYSLAANCSFVMTFVLDAIESSYVPWLYTKLSSIQIKHSNMAIKEIRKTENTLLIIVGTLLVILMLFSPELIRIMGSIQYMASIWVIPPVVGSLFFLFQTKLFVSVEMYYENKKGLLFSSVISALINIVLNALLLPKFGFVVAGYTTLISYIVFSAMNYRSSVRIEMGDNLKSSSSDLFDGRFLLLSSTAFLAIILIMVYLYSVPIIRYLVIVALLVVLAFGGKRIVSIIMQLFS